MLKKAMLPLSLLIVFTVGAIVVLFPHKVHIESDPQRVVFHDRERHEVVSLTLEEDDIFHAEVRRIVARDSGGWRVIIRQLSLGETAPSIEIFGENNSYELSIWPDQAVLGFLQSEKSYRKKLNPRVHSRLVDLIKERKQVADTALRGAEGGGGSEESNP